MENNVEIPNTEGEVPKVCVKCWTKDNLQRHHIEPKVHFGNKAGCPKCWMCAKHHREFETILVRAEGAMLNKHRTKRNRHFYHEMLLYYILFS